VVLVGVEEWGPGDHVRGRRLLPFTERDGSYNGPPADGERALAELERQRQQGARYFGIWWTASWWLDEYPAVREHLHVRGRRVLDTDAVTLFELAS
jgi:hypothetical protein